MVPNKQTSRYAWTAVLAGVLLCACGRDSKPAGEPPREPPAAERPRPSDGRMEDGFFVAADAPPPLECATDDECTVNTVLTENGCCINPRRVWVPQAQRYSYWASQYRQQHCENVECPPLPAPYPPEKCATEARCVEGACRDRCDAPAE